MDLNGARMIDTLAHHSAQALRLGSGARSVLAIMAQLWLPMGQEAASGLLSSAGRITLANQAGLEPATCGFGDRRSTKLSYWNIRTD